MQQRLSHPLRHYEDLEVVVVSDFQQVMDEDPQVVFALGGAPLKVLQELSIIPKGRTTNSQRGKKLLLPNGVPVMVSYSPDILDIDYGLYITLLTDTGMVARLAATGSLEAKLGSYQYVDDFAPFITRVEELYSQSQKAVRVALDLETIGLDEFRLPEAGIGGETQTHPGARIVCIQATCEPGMAHVRYFASMLEEQEFLTKFETASQVSYILSSPKISLVGANLKFDLRWLFRRGGFTCTNFKFDTTLVGSLLDENRANGLDVHAKIYVPPMAGYSDVFDQTVDKSRMDLVPKDQLLPYAGGDTDACLRVSEVMKRDLLADPQLTAFYVNILHPAARAFERLERSGVLVDQQKMDALEADLNTEALKLVHRAKQIYGGRLVAKHADDEKAGGMNITKASLITEFMFSKSGLNLTPIDFTPKPDKYGNKKPSTSMDHILKFKDVPEAQELVSLLKDYGSLTKTLSTYVVGFRKHLRSDGRFHPSFWFFAGDKDEGEGGTNTGRLSCKDPAIQTVPVHTVWAQRILECYIAPPGYVIGGRDYSQGELRVIACIAGEPTMIEAYRQGMDLHLITAAKVSGRTYDEMLALKKVDKHLFSELRSMAKPLNFGLIYLISPSGLQMYAELSYGVKFSLSQAQEYYDQFFDLYPGISAYHEFQKKWVKKHKSVRSPLGRIRHLPLIDSPRKDIRAQQERRSVNAPTQSTLSDMMLWSFAECEVQMSEAYDQGWIQPFSAIHDAGYDYLLEDKAEELIKQQVEIMENLPFHKVGWSPSLTFKADAKLGPNMGDMEELKL